MIGFLEQDQNRLKKIENKKCLYLWVSIRKKDVERKMQKKVSN